MSSAIFEAECSIAELIKKEVDETTHVHSGTPQSFLAGFNNELPCILVSYTGSTPYKNMYPGELSFIVSYISYRTDRETIYNKMEKVVARLLHKELNGLNAPLLLQSEQIAYEDGNYLVFTQQWTCTKIEITDY